MATPYTNSNTGGTLPLPRVHIPTWFGIMSPSENNDALLDLDLLTYENNNPMYTINNNVVPADGNEGDHLLDMGGINVLDTETSYKDIVSIGDIPPREGNIIAYSDDDENILQGTSSSHVLYFEHAELHKFNFSIPHNHVIDRIEKLYRKDISNNSMSDLDTSVDAPDVSSRRLVINSTNDGSITSGSTKLILIEGGY